jgi:hypothetical protein
VGEQGRFLVNGLNDNNNSYRIQGHSPSVETQIGRNGMSHIEAFRPHTHDSQSGHPEAQSTLPYKTGGRSRPNYNRKIRFPDRFDDSKVNWTDWIRHFETVGRYNEWSSSEMADNMIMSLQASCLSEIPDEKMRDYDALKQWLSARFDPTEQELSWKVQFRCRNYKKGKETIADFGRDMTKLSRKAFPRVPSNQMDELIIDAFCNGMQDEDMKRHVLFRHPQTMDRAIALATEYEAMEATQPKSKPKPVVSFGNVYKMQEEDSTLSEICNAIHSVQSDMKGVKQDISSVKSQVHDRRKTHGDNMQRNGWVENDRYRQHGAPLGGGDRQADNQQPNPRRRARNLACFNCGDERHFARNCPLKHVTAPALPTPTPVNQGN